MLFDLLARDPKGRHVAAIEAKRIRPTTSDWARQFHRNLLAHGQLDADWLIIVTPDYAYAFRELGDRDSQPDVVVETRSRFDRYYKQLKASPENISSGTFEHVVTWWFEDLAAGRIRDPELEPSGLASRLQGTTIIQQAA